MMLKRILKDALPTMISMMLVSMYGVIDGLFVGASNGDVGLAAINIAWPLTALILGLGVGIGGGGSVLLSYYAGQKEEEKELATFKGIMTLLLLVSVIAFVVLQSYPYILKGFGATGEILIEAEKYCSVIVMGVFAQVLGTGVMPILRNSSMSFQAMLIMILGLVLNIGINYYLLFVQGMGVIGTAYGTVISQSSVVILGVLLLATKTKYQFGFSIQIPMIKDIIKSGITLFGLYLAPSITLIFTNWQCIKYGGDIALASYAVVSYIIFPVQSMLGGIGDGTQPLISFYQGSEKWDALKEVQSIALKMVAIMGILLTVITLLAADTIGHWFGLSEEAFSMYMVGMNLASIGFLIVGIVRFRISYLNAIKKNNKAMIFTFMDSLMISPILLYVLPLVWGMNGVWLAYLGTAIVMCIILFGLDQG